MLFIVLLFCINLIFIMKNYKLFFINHCIVLQ